MLGNNCPLHICLRWDQMTQILSAICGTVSERKRGNKLKWGEVGKKTTIFPFLCALFPNRLVTSILNPHRLHLSQPATPLFVSPHPHFVTSPIPTSLIQASLKPLHWPVTQILLVFLKLSPLVSTMQCKDIDPLCV